MVCDPAVPRGVFSIAARARPLCLGRRPPDRAPQVRAADFRLTDPARRCPQRVVAPVGVLLPSGLGLKIDQADVGRAGFVRCLPNAPTVAGLHQSDWYSVESVVSKETVRRLIPLLLEAGAEGIIEYPLNKIV